MSVRLVAALSCCLLLPAALAQTTASAVTAKRIAVVSLLGHNVSLLKIGFMVFGNQYAKTNTAAPEVAEPVRDALIHELQREPGATVRHLPVSRTDLESWGALALASSSGFSRAPLRDLQDVIAQMAATCDCDEILFLTDNLWRELNGTNQTARGLTLLHINPEQSVLVLPLTLTRVSPKTLKPLSDAGLGFQTARVPYLWPDGKLETVAQPIETLTAATTALAEHLAARDVNAFDGLRFALFKMGLRPSCVLLNHNSWRYGLPPKRRGEPDEPPRVQPGTDPSSCA